MGRKSLLLISIPILLLAACTSSKNDVILDENFFDQNSGFHFSETTTISSIAIAGSETQIALGDGAAIVVPSESIAEDVSVKLARNPESMNALPPLDENVVQLSDFYNFQMTGNLSGPADLILPFDPDLIPDKDGLLTIASPNGDGWEYIPVIPNGDKVTLYTKNLGGYLIAWHFVDSENEYLSYKLESICDPRIGLNVLLEKSLNEERITIVGSILPFSDDFGYRAGTWLASSLIEVNTDKKPGVTALKLIFNGGQEVNVDTEADGTFQYKVNIFDGKLIKGSINQIEAVSECDSLFGASQENIGYATFNWKLLPEEDPDIEIPEGAVLLPNFAGHTTEEAKDWLKKNNFKYTWIDGSSYLEPGIVYDQAPAGEQYKVPHRTLVVLFNTFDKLPALPLTYVVNECVENYYRIMNVDQVNETGFTLGDKTGSCEGEWRELISSIEQIDDDIIQYVWVTDESSGEIVIDLKTVVALTNPIPTDRFIVWPIEEYTWAEDWGEGFSTAYEIKFVREETISILDHSRIALVYEGEYEEHVTFTDYDNASISEVRKSIYYFDKITGFNLRVEHFKWLVSCEPECLDIAGEITSKTVLELVETDWDLGN